MSEISHTKRLFLIFHGRFPSEKAAALFAGKSAAAFASLGREVVLLVPRRLGRAAQSAYDFYGLPNNFRVIFLPTLDLFALPLLKRFAFGVSFFSFSIFLFFYLLLKANKSDIVYSNESLPLLLASSLFPETVYEIHDFPKNNFYYRTIFRRVKAFVATNFWKKEKIWEMFGIPPDRIIAEMNAVSLEDFSPNIGKHEARNKLNLPQDAAIICYAGMLRTMGMEKGIATALEALGKLPRSPVLLLVGGSSEDVSFYRSRALELGLSFDRVLFAGFVPHARVPLHLSAADVLIAPFPKNDHYEFYMSPMKIFEYMAVNRPIVASDLHSVREILPEGSALFVPPGDASALADGIATLLQNEEEASRYASCALEKVLEHTWEKRADRILKYLERV